VFTILIADDQQEMRAIHADYLTRHGYRVLSVSDGEEALRQARCSSPDIILLDHSMPGRRGIDVARELKADAATAHIPVLLMTAHAYGAVGRRAREAGCAAFLSKPCGPRRVLEEVRRHVPAVPATA
jgi:two-component system, cell cycle response regulator DivK